jgi:hypothetical protein
MGKRSVGRPKLPEQERRDITYTIRLNEPEKDMVTSVGTSDTWRSFMVTASEVVKTVGLEVQGETVTPERLKYRIGDLFFRTFLEVGVSDSVKISDSVKVEIEGGSETKT